MSPRPVRTGDIPHIIALISDVFAEYGLDVDGLAMEESAVQIAGSAIAVELAAALDDWADVRARAGSNDEGADRLRRVAVMADDDIQRTLLRESLLAVESS